MLIDSPRIDSRDRAAWLERARYDTLLARSNRLNRLEAKSISYVREWREAGDGIVSVSWGKDSVVAAHIALKVDPALRLVWVRSDPFETPECEQVRDAFLATHPECGYEERIPHLRNPKRGEPGYVEHRENPDRKSQDVLGELIHERWISGLRGQESSMRRKSIAWLGVTTSRTSRPLAWWTGVDIFAYLHREQLPVHPVYAMSFGGALDRQWLRVHPLCSAIPNKDDRDIARWEDHYYGDHIQTALAQRAAWRAAGDPRGGREVSNRPDGLKGGHR